MSKDDIKDTSKKKIDIGKIISTCGILGLIVVAMFGYVSQDKFINPISKDLNAIYKNKDTSINQKLKATKKTIESKTNDIFLKNTYINVNTAVDLSLGSPVVKDASQNVAKLNNGYLSFIYANKGTSTQRAKYLIDVQESIKKTNPSTDLLYIQAPFKVSKYDKQLPSYIKETSNLILDEFLQEIDGKVNYIDIREEMHNDGLNQYDYFFKTDHHWTPEGAFYAYNKLTDYLQTNCDFKIDSTYTDINNFNVDVYKNWFLGSEGKRLGIVATGLDDISLIYPKFDTDYVFDVPAKNIHREGTYYNSMFRLDQIEEKVLYVKNPYATYIGGDYPLNTIKNNVNTNGKKILLIRDSFGRPFAPLLSLVCEELDVLDLRYYKDMSIEDYVAKTNPDVVVFMNTRTPVLGYDR